MSDAPIAGPPENETVADHDSDPGDVVRRSTIGRYVVLDSVGMGGMGLVCAAWDPKLNRKVALKLLRNPNNEEANAKGRSRLFREAQALARLSHPNVVTVHDVDVFEKQVYIAMEFVEGMSLREWLRREPAPGWKEILAKFIAAGRGLMAAHEANIIHRDFKPANVLLGNEGEVRVADFGVAKDEEAQAEQERMEFERHRRTSSPDKVESEDLTATSEEALIEEMQSNVSRQLTMVGRMVGTPAYMAPEQHLGFRVGPYTDQYAFCVSLYEALYGRLPYEGVDRRDQLAKMSEGKLSPPPKEGRGREVPKRIYRILARGLRPQAAERWSSMEDLLDALERDPAKRLRWAAALGAGGLGLAAGLFGLTYGYFAQPARDCEALSADIEAHWSAERRADLEQAFENSERPFAADMARRTTTILDRWSSTWTSTRLGICDATLHGGQPEDMLRLRMSCLDEHAAELDAVVALLLEADDTVVERSVKLAYAIPDPSSCVSAREREHEDDLEPSSLRGEQVAELTADLNRAFALAEASKFDESLPIQTSIVERARALEHRRTLMRALYDLALSQLSTGEAEAGEQSLREAIALAAELGDVDRELQAWARMTFMIGAERERFVEGHAWALATESALIRAGRPPRGELLYESAIGALEFREGHVEVARQHYGEALSLSRVEYGVSHPKTITMMINYGVAQARLGKHEEAAGLMREAIARSKEAYGPSHPILASYYYNLGQVHLLAEEPEKAEDTIRASFEIRERNAPNSPSLANPLSALAKLALADGRLEEARVAFERVLRLRIQAKGRSSAQVAAVLTDLGKLHQARGDYEASRRSYDEVAEIYADIYPDGHLHIAGLEKHRARLFMAQDSWVEAVEACERALEIEEQLDADAKHKIEVYELLADAEAGRGRHLAAERARERARTLQAELDKAKQAKAEASSAKPKP